MYVDYKHMSWRKKRFSVSTVAREVCKISKITFKFYMKVFVAESVPKILQKSYVLTELIETKNVQFFLCVIIIHSKQFCKIKQL